MMMTLAKFFCPSQPVLSVRCNQTINSSISLTFKPQKIEELEMNNVRTKLASQACIYLRNLP